MRTSILAALSLLTLCACTVRVPVAAPTVRAAAGADDGAEGEGEGEGDVGEGEGDVGEGEGEGDVGEGEGEGEGEGDVSVGVARPAGMPGVGFFVKEGAVYDADGAAFVMHGVNHTHWWGNQTNNLAAIAEIAKTHVNAVRAVFGGGMGADTPAEKRAVVERYLDNDLVPIVENHDATCDEDRASIDAVVDDWLLPDNVAWLVEHERYLILNIANEWGPFDNTVWFEAYRDALVRLRGAGVHALVMIDAGGACGQNPRSIKSRGQDLIDADPDHSVVFSVHLYQYWRTSEAQDVGSWNDFGTGTPWSIAEELGALRELGLPFVVGEFGYDSSYAPYHAREAMQTFLQMNIGFLAWSWNQNSDPVLDLLQSNTAYTYDDASDLSPWGQLFFDDAVTGIMAITVPATVFE